MFPLPRHREGSLKQETKSIYYQKTDKYNDIKIQLLFTKRHPQENKKAGHIKPIKGGFPAGAGVENLPANAGDTGSSPGLGRSHMPRTN